MSAQASKPTGTRKRISYLIDDWLTVFVLRVTRCRWFLYGYKVSFLGHRKSSHIKPFPSLEGCHRSRLHFLLIFNMGAVKCFHWPVWAASSSLPVLAVVRAIINTWQLLGNNDKYGSVAIYRMCHIKKRFNCCELSASFSGITGRMHLHLMLKTIETQTRISLNVFSA